MAAADPCFEIALGDAPQPLFDHAELVVHVSEELAREQQEQRQAERHQQRGAEQRLPVDVLGGSVGLGDMLLLPCNQLPDRGHDLQVYGPPVFFQEVGDCRHVVDGEKTLEVIEHCRQFSHAAVDGIDQVLLIDAGHRGHRLKIVLPGQRSFLLCLEQAGANPVDAKIVVEYAIKARRQAAKQLVDLDQALRRLDFFEQHAAQAFLTAPGAPHADAGDSGQRQAGKHDEQQQALADT